MVNRVTCGCCSNGCVCANHLDLPNGRPVNVCLEHLVEAAAAKVAEDMASRPPSGSDGIWRFDRACEAVFGPGRALEFWLAAEKAARAANAGKDTWDRAGFGVVASFASCKAAFATPGFAEARRLYMT